jgi:hypothetical protein
MTMAEYLHKNTMNTNDSDMDTGQKILNRVSQYKVPSKKTKEEALELLKEKMASGKGKQIKCAHRQAKEAFTGMPPSLPVCSYCSDCGISCLISLLPQ